MPINKLSYSNIKWNNLHIGVADRHFTDDLPSPFNIVNAEGLLICNATLQMNGARISAPRLYSEPPPLHLPLPRDPLQVGDEIHWNVRNGDFVIEQIVAANLLANNPLALVAAPAPVVPEVPEVSAGALREIGFRDLAVWEANPHSGLLQYRDVAAQDIRNWPEWTPALYAYVEQDCVRYIGKTRRLLGKRIDDYRRGLGDKTNYRVHTCIRAVLTANRQVVILGFYPQHAIHWGRFRVNLPAGLEDVMIEYFQPEWNAV